MVSASISPSKSVIPTAAQRSQSALTMGGRVKSLLPWLLPVSLGVVLLSALLGAFPQWGWPVTLFCHFRFQYLWLSALLGLSELVILILKPQWLLAKHRGLALLLVTLALATTLSEGLVLRPWLFPVPQPPPVAVSAQTPRLRLMSINLWVFNHRLEAVLKAIEAQNPDAVYLCELDNQWRRRLLHHPRLKAYGYRLISINSQAAILSRLPLQNARKVNPYTASGRLIPLGQFLVADILSPQGFPLTFIGIHPKVPCSPQRYQDQKDSLMALAQYRDTFQPHTVVVGDYNTTSYSDYFQAMVSSLKMRDSQLEAGLQASWPSQLPSPFRITLDQVLLSRPVVLLKREIGPRTGSDHWPVTINVALDDPLHYGIKPTPRR